MSEIKLTDEDLLNYLENNDFSRTSEADQLEIIAEQQLLDSVDDQTGAPFAIRAQVMAAQSPEDRLETIRKFYPDALPAAVFSPRFGEQRFGRNNFIYTDENGKLKAFDEDFRIFGMAAPTLRDVFADAGPEVAEVVGAVGGGIAGGIAGAASGLGVGSIPAGAAGILIGEGLGSATARELYIELLSMFGETEDSRTLSDQFLDYSTTATLNGTLGPISNKLLNGVKYQAGASLNYVLGGNSQRANALIKAGITDPSVGVLTGNTSVQMIEGALASAPPSTKAMQKNAQQTINQIEQSVNKITEKYGGSSSKFEVGEKTYKYLQNARNKFDLESNRLYSEISDLIDPNITTDGKFIKQVIEDITRDVGQSQLAKGQNKAILEYAKKYAVDLKNGTLNYNTLKNIRTHLGKDLGDPLTAGATGGERAQFKRLYSAITKDLEELVTKSGNKEALKKVKAANAFTKSKLASDGSITYVDNLLKKARDGDFAKITKSLISGAKDGPAQLRKLREEFTEDEFEALSGYFLGSLGNPKAGIATPELLGRESVKDIMGGSIDDVSNFSPQTFITQYETLSDEAKDILFRGGRYEDLVPELDNLVAVINEVKVASVRGANPSQTAKGIYSIGLLSTFVGELGGINGKSGGSFDYGVGAILGTYGTAKLLTNKSFVNWLSQGVKQVAYDPNSFVQHVRRLYQIHELNPDIRDEVEAVLHGLSHGALEIPEELNAKTQPPVSGPVENEANFREVSTSEVSNLLMPEIERQDVPRLDVDMLDDTRDPALALSPTIVPDEKDREIAMRSSGIGSLV